MSQTQETDIRDVQALTARFWFEANMTQEQQENTQELLSAAAEVSLRVGAGQTSFLTVLLSASEASRVVAQD